MLRTNYIRTSLIMLTIVVSLTPVPCLAVVHGDVELLKTVALQHKANLESLLTLKGEAFEERISTRGDSYDYMIRNKCIFAYDQLQNAVRWNKEPQENRLVVDGKSLRDINAFYNSAMIKDQSSYQYSALGLRDGKETYHLVIGDLKRAKKWGDFCLDPRYFFANSGSNPIYDRLMHLYDAANNPKLHEWYVKRIGDLVTLEVQFGENDNKIEKYVFDLSAAGNLVEYYNKTPSAENAREYTYEEKSGVWILKSFKRTNITHREDGDLRSTRTINWSKSVVNVPFEEDEFTVEKLGVKYGDDIHDHRIVRRYKYEGIIVEAPLRPKVLMGKRLPQFKDFRIQLSSQSTKDKMLLVCFWDMQQRPSRNCIMQLAKQAAQLKQKGVTIVAVQASKADRAKLDEWIKDKNIPFPVGMIQANEEKTRFTWGVRSLPWLILTDKEHIVRTEGFSINELNERIATLREK